jgi:hypothetical protein
MMAGDTSQPRRGPSAVAPARAPRLSASRGFRRSVRAFTACSSFLIAACFLLPNIASAQASLNFLRVTVNWPTMELYFRVGCDGKPGYDVQKENLRILENGYEIPEFTLWCPDPTFRCAGSFVLVADASGSMHGAGMQELQRDLNVFTQLMDGVVDESALIAAGRTIRIMQPMTPQRSLLHSAIDSLRASGASALYDGVMEGVRNLMENGVNSCRAVIVFGDGWDNLSTATVAEVISFANRNRIRIFAVGVGTFVNTESMETMAKLTGGRFLMKPEAEQLEAMYREITTGAIGNFNECIVTYDRDCADGSERTVELQLVDLCGGSDAKTKNYRAPLDPSYVPNQRLRIGEIVSTPREFVTVPLVLEGVSREKLLRPFDVTIHSGSTGNALVDVDIPAASPIAGAAVIIDRHPDSVRVRLNAAVSANAGVTLLEMKFSTAAIKDSAWFPLHARIRDVDALCARTEVDSGGYRIVPRLLPRITPEGMITICPRGETMLQANEGFVAYRWSTGDTTRGTKVSREGQYYLYVIDGIGDTLRSDVVELRKRPERNVWIASSGPLTFCNGGAVTLSVAGDTTSTQRYWHNSRNPEETFIARNSGSYWASVLDEFGCRHYTDTIVVTETEPPVTLNIGNNYVYICPGDSIELRVVEDYPHYYWQREGGAVDSTRSIIATATGGVMSGGKYNVRVRTAEGCEGNWQAVYVVEKALITPTLFPNRVVLCPGGEAYVGVKESFASYHLWSTGDTTRGIVVRDTGMISVEVGFGGCPSQSLPLEIEMVDIPRPRITTGPFTALCPGDYVLLDAGDGYADYRWSTGDTSRIVTVSDPGPYFVDVMAYGGCWGRSDTIVVRQEMVDFPRITHADDLILCPGDSLLLEAPTGYMQYLWNTGDSAQAITVRASGMYVVMVLSAGGCEGISLPVFVQQRVTETPTILREGLVLSTGSRVLSIQWFRDGQPISGAITPIFTVSETGRYAVQIVDSCGAVLMSDEINITTLGTESRPEVFRLDVYPDPSEGMIHVELRGARGSIHAELLDLLGRRITHREWTAYGDLREQLDFRGAPPGIYLLRLARPDGLITRRVTKIQ